ncbi:MAG: UDP-forming cellulose synthase catalytic subunit [Alphaproteobacteria bacterium]
MTTESAQQTRHAPRHDDRVESRMLQALWVALAILLTLVAAQPLDLISQAILAGVALCFLFAIRGFNPQGFGRIAILCLALFISGRYFFWRTFNTLAFDGPLSFLASATLYAAELYGFSIFLLGVFVSIRPLDRPERVIPVDPDPLPTVDILVPSYNEDASLLETTLLAAAAIQYPVDKMNIYLLDDGGTTQKRQDPDPVKAQAAEQRRKELQALCRSTGAHYLTRERNESAKAGNLNAALEHVQGDLILILDADHVPTHDILKRTVVWFMDNPKLFLVQTPHFFINPDPIERNLDLFEVMPSENEMFYRVIQPGLDMWNASFFCGSAAVLRRCHLDEIGGITGETITEDAETALALHARGYDSVYVNRPMVAGLAPESLSAFITQRSRWTQGMVQIFMLKNPLRLAGLTIKQRLGYLSASLFWFFPFARLVFLLSPLAYLLFGLSIYKANLSQVAAYTLPHIIGIIAASNFMYGRVRWQFVSELYELMLSFSCLGAIIKVIRSPRSPTFVVTPKGEDLEDDFISTLATPFYIVISLMLLGIIGGIYQFFRFPLSRDLTVIVLAWNGVNLLLMVAAIGILFERRQRRADPRVPTQDMRAVLTHQSGAITCRVADISMGGARLHAEGPFTIPAGQTAEIGFVSGGFGTLPSVSAQITGGREFGDGQQEIRLRFEPESAKELSVIVNAMHGRSQSWKSFQSRRTTNNNSLRQVTVLTAHGFRSGLVHFFKLFAPKAI